ncbi:hypothetical protein [Longibacter sp.]|uniref:hypothetical protein n=1 Tax=Longibacter sp. TaxID=2045415 RepID=UPI003EB813AE
MSDSSHHGSTALPEDAVDGEGSAALASLDPGTRARIDGIAHVARHWSEAEYDRRADAEQATLDANNTFTDEAIAFALNQWASIVTPASLADAVREWGGGRSDATREEVTVCVQHGSSTPADGLRELVAALAMGYRVRSIVPDVSPAIVPALVQDLTHPVDGLKIEVVQAGTKGATDGADVLVLARGETGDSLRETWLARGGDTEAIVQGPAGYGVGIIDGSEPDEERHNLAEDALLHEGYAPTALKVLWAPADLTPDPMLEAMADFRGVFPAHEDTPGALEMQRAFLEAQDASHAYAAGMQFLVSRGGPEPQRGAHLRWSEYEGIEDVASWIHEHHTDIGAVIARSSVQGRLPESLQNDTLRNLDIVLLEPGYVHRRPLLTRRVRVLLNRLAEQASSEQAS